MLSRFDLRSEEPEAPVSEPGVLESGTIRITEGTVRMAVPESVRRLSIPTPAAPIALALVTTDAYGTARSSQAPVAMPMLVFGVTMQQVRAALVASAALVALASAMLSIALVLFFR